MIQSTLEQIIPSVRPSPLFSQPVSFPFRSYVFPFHASFPGSELFQGLSLARGSAVKLKLKTNL